MAALSAATLAVATAGQAAADVVPVTPASTDWSATASTGGFLRGGGSYSIEDTYGAPAGFGTGSLVLSTPDADPAVSDKVTFSKLAPVGTTLAALDATDISYFTKRIAGGAQQVAALNIAVDSNGAAAGGFTTLVFEPVYNTDQGPVTDGAWQRWDANDDAIWWSSNPIPSAPNRDTFVSLDTIIASNPDAVVLTIAVNQGGGNPGLVTAVDAYSALGTTYDFETVSTPPRSADECRDGGWQSNFAAGEFRNQGDCVSYFASNGRSHL